MNLRMLPLLFCVATGCTTLQPIKPAELPKLNGSYHHIRAWGPNYFVGESSLRQVETPDGRLVEIRGKFDAHVTLENGEVVEFAHPVESDLAEGSLTVRSKNRVPTSFALDDVAKVEVTQIHFGRTLGLILGVAGGVLALALGGLFAAIYID